MQLINQSIFQKYGTTEEFIKIGDLITKIIQGLSKNSEDNSKIEKKVLKEISQIGRAHV